MENTIISRMENGKGFGCFDIETTMISVGNQEYLLGGFCIGDYYVECETVE